MLRLEAVGRRFGAIDALHDVTLEIEPGGCTVLLGPSGCGKSTLLRLIAGLDAPDRGRIVWTAGHPPPPGRIGMVFQDPVLLPWASAADNVALPLRLAGGNAATTRAASLRGLAEVGLAGFEDARPRALSGGMRMRVALGRALSTNPDLLLMDEPFAALDEPTRHRLQDDLRVLHQQRRCTIVFVTHSVTEAMHIASRIVRLSPRPGRIVETLRPPPHTSRADPVYLTAAAALSSRLE